MIDAILAAALLTSPQPSPSSSALPVIITVHSRAECATRLQATSYAIPGLLMNDRIVQRSELVLGKMAQDSAQHASSAQRTMDGNYLERLTQAMAHNLKVLKSLIAQVGATTKPNQPDPLVERLKNVAAVQADEWNAVNGIGETSRLGQLQDDNPFSSMRDAVSPIGTRGVPVERDSEPIFDAGLPNAGLVPGAIPTSQPIFPATSIYGPIARTLTNDAQLTDQRENDLAETVRSEVVACGGHQPSPAPAATP